MSNAEIGSRLKSIRLEKGYTLDEVAASVGVAKSTIQRYEAGKISSIKLPVIESIARFLNVNPAWVIGKSTVQDVSYDLITHNVPYSAEGFELIEMQKEVRHKKLLVRLSAYHDFLYDYLQLNDAGKEKLHEQLKLLSKIPEYQEETELPPAPVMLNAAHADAGASTEDKKYDEDIMNDNEKWGK